MHPLTKAVKSLTIVAWCLCGVLVAHFCFSLFAYIDTWRFMHGGVVTTTREIPPTSKHHEFNPPVEEERPRLHELPPEQMVAKASVILVTTYREESGRNKAIVTEIIKEAPSTKLYYKLGDEFAMLSNYRKNDECPGQGQVVFMAGSPAEMECCYGYTNDRISGLGDMPLETLRQMVNSKKP